MFGGIRYTGCEGLSSEERGDYRRTMSAYVRARKDRPAYQRADGSTARQALAIERDLRTLVQGRILALVPKPEIVERVQGLAYTVRHLTSPEAALDLALNRIVSRAIVKALDAAPALVPMAVAVLVAKDVLGALNEASLSEQEKMQQVEDEHRHDREWQFVRENSHECERER